MWSARWAALVCAAAMTCAGQAGEPIAADREQATAVFRMFLRDSAELPMDVAVTTVVTDPHGREKRRTRATVHLLFKGYSQQAERFSLTSRSGMFHLRELHDSIAGDFSIFKAFSMVAPGKDGQAKWDVAEEAEGLLVRFVQADCKPFDLAGELFPRNDCSAVEFHLGRDPSGALKVERFTLDSLHLPVPGTLRYLGAVQVRKYHVEGDVQNGYLPNDPRPFLVPKRVVTTIETEKGRIVLTNDHTMAAKK
jgi:hypothetical protein